MEGMALFGKWPEVEKILLAFSGLHKSFMNIYEKDIIFLSQWIKIFDIF